jgi:hypothetical protein
VTTVHDWVWKPKITEAGPYTWSHSDSSSDDVFPSLLKCWILTPLTGLSQAASLLMSWHNAPRTPAHHEMYSLASLRPYDCKLLRGRRNIALHSNQVSPSRRNARQAFSTSSRAGHSRIQFTGVGLSLAAKILPHSVTITPLRSLLCIPPAPGGNVRRQMTAPELSGKENSYGSTSRL